VNINGTDKRKKKLFVIDKAYKSHCFNNAEQLPVEYAMNKEWMPFNIFNSMWNEIWREKTKILLLVNNYPAHPCMQNSTKLRPFLPPNTTFVLQLLDSCITKSGKCYFNDSWFSS